MLFSVFFSCPGLGGNEQVACVTFFKSPPAIDMLVKELEKGNIFVLMIGSSSMEDAIPQYFNIHAYKNDHEQKRSEQHRLK